MARGQAARFGRRKGDEVWSWTVAFVRAGFSEQLMY
jgi:hypothetical protein